MLHSGLNDVDGVPVEVARKRIRRINLRIGTEGVVRLSVPMWWATLGEGEDFLRSKWKWVLKVRAETLARSQVVSAPVADAELAALRRTLDELNSVWALRLGERGVVWRIRKLKSMWGCCHFRERYITYGAELASVPREIVEYVVVHELTHFSVHGHGPRFYQLMDERLPDWRQLRKRLNQREWENLRPPGSPAARILV